MIRRTMLFIPGNSPSMLMNSTVFGSDSIIFDLEDAVSQNQKDAARILVRNALLSFDFSEYEVCVRINCIGTELWKDDVAEIIKGNPDTIVLPKAESADNIKHYQSILMKLKKNTVLKKR